MTYKPCYARTHPGRESNDATEKYRSLSDTTASVRLYGGKFELEYFTPENSEERESLTYPDRDKGGDEQFSLPTSLREHVHLNTPKILRQASQPWILRMDHETTIGVHEDALVPSRG